MSIVTFHQIIWGLLICIWIILGRRFIFRGGTAENKLFLAVRILVVGFFLTLIFLQPQVPELYSASDLIGVAMTSIGFSLAVWARWTLGQAWSATVAFEGQGQLIKSGPYSRLRHPIYVGLFLTLAGTAVTFHQWLLWVLLMVLAPIYFGKLKLEERTLLSKWGESYRAYMRETWF